MMADVTDVLQKTGLAIRSMRRDEIEAVAAAIGEMPAAQFENRLREQDLGFREVLVAEVDGDLVGTVSIGESARPRRSLHLFALEVAPAWRNQGIGRSIIEYVIDEARRRGLERVHLEVRIDNRARRLYHRLGFRRVGEPFINSWVLFQDDGSRERIEELAVRMIRRV
jgi:ribosomal protein S18 acetylase RimI-like enzyme